MVKTPKHKCPICSCAQFVFDFLVTRQDNRYAYTQGRKEAIPKYYTCAACGVMSFYDSLDYEGIYSDGTYYGVDGEPMAFLTRRFKQVIAFPKGKSDNCERIERIRNFLKTQKYFQAPSVKSILDVGAGMGVFLHKFLDERWRGTALEPDPNACIFMKKVLKKATVIEGVAKDLPPQKQYDLITLNRVLEHIYDPFKILRDLKKYLKEEGILYLELPDVLSYYADGPNNEAFGWGHYLVYSPEALLSLTSQTGYEMVGLARQVEPSSKFTIYGFFKKRHRKRND